MLHAHDSDKIDEKRAIIPKTPDPKGPDGILALQRTVGNAAVARALQQQDGSARTAVQRMADRDSSVLSGHGRFGQNQLIPKNPANPRSRALKPTFTVPEGIEIVMYAPPGASLENDPAQRIEQGDPPTRDQLELVLDQQRKDLPEDYPRTFRAGEELINYQVTPLQAQHLSEGAETVNTATTLQKRAEELAKQRRESGAEGPLTLHYACCGAGHSDRKEDEGIFAYKGWSVMMRRLPVPGKRQASGEPEESRETNRRR